MNSLELVDREIAGALTHDERSESECLQREMRAYREYRRLIIDIVALARKYKTSLYEKLVGFPVLRPCDQGKTPNQKASAGVSTHFIIAENYRRFTDELLMVVQAGSGSSNTADNVLANLSAHDKLR